MSLEAEKDKIRIKYSSLVQEPREFWNRKPVKKFFNAYKPEITEMPKEYPKVELDGVLMLEGMEKRDMPFQKEFYQAKLISNILNNEVILLPRYATNTIEKTFGITLQTGSFPDELAALIDGDKYIEFKSAKDSNLVTRLNEASTSSDIGFIIMHSVNRNIGRRLKSSHSQFDIQKGFKGYIFNLPNKNCFEIKKIRGAKNRTPRYCPRTAVFGKCRSLYT